MTNDMFNLLKTWLYQNQLLAIIQNSMTIVYMVLWFYLTLSQSQVLQAAILNYSHFATVDEIEPADRIIFSLDSSQALLYSPSNTTPTVISILNHEQISNPAQYTFNSPLFIQYFSDAFDSTHLLYGTGSSQIRSKMFLGTNKYKQTLIYAIPQQDQCTIKKLVVSTDGKKWAADCEVGYTAYYGALEQNTRDVTVIFYDSDSVIDDIEWRPSSYELVISGNNFVNSTSYIYVHNIQTKESTQLQVQLTKVMDIVFSSDDELYLLDLDTISSTSTNIKKYDFNTQSYTQHQLQPKARYVSVKNHFLCFTTNDGWQYIYMANSSNYNGSNILFKFNSDFLVSGLGPDGAFFVEEISGMNKVELYKMCKEGESYNSQSNSCLPCQEGCLDCLFSPNQCISCQQSYSFNPQSHQCSAETSYLMWIIIGGASIAFILILTISIVLFKRHRKHKNKTDQKRESVKASGAVVGDKPPEEEDVNQALMFLD